MRVRSPSLAPRAVESLTWQGGAFLLLAVSATATGLHSTWLILRSSKQPATLTLRQPSLGLWIEDGRPSLRAAGIVGIPHAIRLLF
jgi:hypothetical protein